MGPVTPAHAAVFVSAEKSGIPSNDGKDGSLIHVKEHSEGVKSVKQTEEVG